MIPLLQKLGYDVFNPLEERPEYVSDFGEKKGEKGRLRHFQERRADPVYRVQERLREVA